MSLSADDVVLECNIEILGRERPLLNEAWLEMQNMYATLADARYPDVNVFIESCELFGVIVVTDGYFERKGALEKWNSEQGQVKGEMGAFEEQAQTNDDFVPVPHVQQAGVAYLKSIEPGEATVGVYITDAWQAETFDVQIIKLLLRWAFEEVGFHRIQTSLLEGRRRVPLMKLFSHVGFSHEGTRRKALAGPDAVYKDVTCMGMVDMDWRVWAVHAYAPKTLWDRLFDRQQREREEIMTDDGDDEDRFLGKKASTETLRANVDEYVRSAKSTTTTSIVGGSGSNAVTSSSTGLSGSDWDKFDLPESPVGDHKSVPSLESEFEYLALKQDSTDEPAQSAGVRVTPVVSETPDTRRGMPVASGSGVVYSSPPHPAPETTIPGPDMPTATSDAPTPAPSCPPHITPITATPAHSSGSNGHVLGVDHPIARTSADSSSPEPVKRPGKKGKGRVPYKKLCLEAWIAANKNSDKKAFNAHWRGLDKAGRKAEIDAVKLAMA